MPQWNSQPYQGINSSLLQALVDSRDKNAAGLDAMSGPLFGGINSAIGQIPGMMQQKNQNQFMQQLMSYLQNNQQGSSAFGGGQGMPNPMKQSMGNQTSMMNDPLGIFGGQ